MFTKDEIIEIKEHLLNKRKFKCERNNFLQYDVLNAVKIIEDLDEFKPFINFEFAHKAKIQKIDAADRILNELVELEMLKSFKLEIFNKEYNIFVSKKYYNKTSKQDITMLLH